VPTKPLIAAYLVLTAVMGFANVFAADTLGGDLVLLVWALLVVLVACLAAFGNRWQREFVSLSTLLLLPLVLAQQDYVAFLLLPVQFALGLWAVPAPPKRPSGPQTDQAGSGEPA